MKPLQITLFILANVIFITQAGRHVHQLLFGVRASVLDEFSPEKEKARAKKHIDALVADYRIVHEEISTIEKGRNHSEVTDIRQTRHDLYERKEALASEIGEREHRNREIRDLWIFSALGSFLICVGAVLYRSNIVWPGFSILVTGFGILEYWTSPTFFGGAAAEFQSLLVAKALLTVLSLLLLYVFWLIREPKRMM